MRIKPMSKITYAQIKKIYAAAQQKGIEIIQGSHDDELHNIVRLATNKTSISQLSKNEAIRVIDRIEGEPIIGENRATAKQVGYIKDLIKELQWDDNPKRLQGFIRKYTKIDKLDWITRKDASNVIEGLKRQVKAIKNVREG